MENLCLWATTMILVGKWKNVVMVARTVTVRQKKRNQQKKNYYLGKMKIFNVSSKATFLFYSFGDAMMSGCDLADWIFIAQTKRSHVWASGDVRDEKCKIWIFCLIRFRFPPKKHTHTPTKWLNKNVDAPEWSTIPIQRNFITISWIVFNLEFSVIGSNEWF